MSGLVVDSSVVMAWCYVDEATAATDALLDRVRAEGMLVPTNWLFEVTNALRSGTRRGRLTDAHRTQFLALLRDLPLSIAPLDLPQALDAVLPLAEKYGLTSGDAAYLELAMREGVPLVTKDEAMRDAATAAGIEVSFAGESTA